MATMKVHLRFFQALLFLLPTQLAYHFWPQYSRVVGLKVDYLSPTIYLTDLVLLAVLLSWVLSDKALFFKRKRVLLFLIPLVGLATLNTFFSYAPQVAALRWLKIIELSLFFLYVYLNSKEIISKKLIVFPFICSLLFVSLIAFLQFLLQRTVGGPLYFLGERTFDASTPGIAKGLYLGHILMRPYSILPHPNVLSGYLAVTLLILIGLYPGLLKKTYMKFVALLAFAAFIISSSLTSYLSFFFVLVGFFFFRNLKPTFSTWLLIVLIGLSILSPFASVGLSKDSSISERVTLSKIGASMVSRSEKTLFIGIGLNNYIPILPSHGVSFKGVWLLQPIHNVYLLTFVETGFVGLFFLYTTLSKILARAVINKKALLAPLLFVLISSLLDHYWITIQQTMLLLTLLLALILGNSKAGKIYNDGQ